MKITEITTINEGIDRRLFDETLLDEIMPYLIKAKIEDNIACDNIEIDIEANTTTFEFYANQIQLACKIDFDVTETPLDACESIEIYYNNRYTVFNRSDYDYDYTEFSHENQNIEAISVFDSMINELHEAMILDIVKDIAQDENE